MSRLPPRPSSAALEAARALCAGADTVISLEELAARLEENRPLRVKLGVDPTTPDIHLGHTVGLSKLRQFQEAGHQAILIIGDFTAMIGDPSGRSATRPQLEHEQVLANARTYQEQAFKVLVPERCRIVFNGEWFEAMSFEDVLRLNSRVTLQQMLQREDFRKRLEEGRPIHAHEIQYPLMQGWDSVVVRADVELGGTDQLFNILVGRDLQAAEGQLPQVALTLPILPGLDGVQKMSKSLGNTVGVNDPPRDMFGKLMSISDATMAVYYPALLGFPVPGDLHPLEAKKRLAACLVARFHSAAAAKDAQEDFETRFSRRDLSAADLPEFAPPPGADVLTAVVQAYAQCFGLAKSRSEIRRLIEAGSIRWNGEKIQNPLAAFPHGTPGILKLDKTRAVRVLGEEEQSAGGCS